MTWGKRADWLLMYSFSKVGKFKNAALQRQPFSTPKTPELRAFLKGDIVTTSFENSGLAEVLLPAIKHDLDLEAQLLVVGTGQALRLGEAGDVDAVLVHARAAEEPFVAAGFGTHRREIMYNDFAFIGHVSDPANITLAIRCYHRDGQHFHHRSHICKPWRRRWHAQSRACALGRRIA